MIKSHDKVLTLKGESGKEYTFKLSLFDTFEDVKDGFTGHGLYIFTKRDPDGNHDLIYIGMASSLKTRFDNHHKEKCILSNGANCIGIHHMNNSTGDSRKEAESDLLSAYNFHCNDQEN